MRKLPCYHHLHYESKEDLIELSPEKFGDIRFENVHFAYSSQAKVFENLSLTIPRGKITAIVGESGSGKSTLMSLLQYIYPINEG